LLIVHYFFNFFDFFDFAVNKQRFNSSLRDAQGIEAVSFFAADKKDTSGKPGPAARRQDAPAFL
jgi:hypothetical protein